MDFAWVVAALHRGLKVTRKSWTGQRPQYIRITREPGQETIAFVGPDGQTRRWMCSSTDVLATDWEEYKTDKDIDKPAIDKLPKAGSMENCEKLSNAINQLLESIGVMPHLTVTLVPGPEDKELTIAIRETSENGEANYPIHVDGDMQIIHHEAIACHVINPDDITKTSIGSPVKSTKPVAGGYEVEDMQNNLGKED